VTQFAECYLLIFGQLAVGGIAGLAVPPFTTIERKTGATVNSDTTKTGQPNADRAMSRNSSSTGKPAGGGERGSAQTQSTKSGTDSSVRDVQEKRR